MLRALRAYEAFLGAPESHDRRVLATPDIDAFCSSSWWTLSAKDAFSPEATGLLFDDGESALLTYEAPYDHRTRGRFSFDSMWGLASSLVGPDPTTMARFLASTVHEQAASRLFWYVTGLPLAWFEVPDVVRALQHETIRTRSPGRSTRRVASLAGGWDGFLARRSRKFRKGLRATLRRCDEAGIQVEWAHARTTSEAAAVFATCLDVELQSWKGIKRCGFGEGPMHEFVRHIFARVAAGPGLDVAFATVDGAPVGFLAGSTYGDAFRGIQMSFVESLRALGLGTFLQSQAIRRAADAGVLRYDLGSEGLPYKSDWAEAEETTVNLLIMPSHSALR